MRPLVEEAHARLKARLKPGDSVIDATAGNGYDTCFLARIVGKQGSVIAIDRQGTALAATRTRLREAELPPVRLLKECHAECLEALARERPRTVAAVVFNLGYLPGSDKRIHTGPATTLRALDASARLLHPGGLLSVTAYTGHEGGPEETAAVARWMEDAKGAGWAIETIEPAGGSGGSPPVLWLASAPDNPSEKRSL